MKLEEIWNCYSRSNICLNSVSVLNDGHKPLSEVVGAVCHAGDVKDICMWTYTGVLHLFGFLNAPLQYSQLQLVLVEIG